MFCRRVLWSLLLISLSLSVSLRSPAEDPDSSAAPPDDPMRALQSEAVRSTRAAWGRWGIDPEKYSSWTNHSNRLVPLYTYGITLGLLREEGSVYADEDRLRQLYGSLPAKTFNPTAIYHDQTDVYRLQQAAIDAGYSYIFLIVFDGMDWQTARAAALYQSGEVAYDRGRGTGLSFMDYRGAPTDFGFVVTSPSRGGARFDVDAQLVLDAETDAAGGFDPLRAGLDPWRENSRSDYLLGKDRELPHAVTDSSSSATSMTSGIKTYNGAINVDDDGSQVLPIARELQRDQGFKIGIVTSVPVSHATPAAGYANNVTRRDYQDLTRDMIGLPSAAHRAEPLPGVDVLIGAGWGEGAGEDRGQGSNFRPGNTYLHEDDLKAVDVDRGGRYVVAQRTAGKPGREILHEAADRAVREKHRLLGFFGTQGGHLPFRTADGAYDPTFDVGGAEKYTPEDLLENPTLADMTEAALAVLERSIDGFWLMIEAGDVDWANHSNNLDNSIGAVLSGDAAFRVVTDWIERNNAWPYSAVIVTADHGHFLVIEDAEAIAAAGRAGRQVSADGIAAGKAE